jgi:hypothetical protein
MPIQFNSFKKNSEVYIEHQTISCRKASTWKRLRDIASDEINWHGFLTLQYNYDFSFAGCFNLTIESETIPTKPDLGNASVGTKEKPYGPRFQRGFFIAFMRYSPPIINKKIKSQNISHFNH